MDIGIDRTHLYHCDQWAPIETAVEVAVAAFDTDIDATQIQVLD